MEACDKLTVWIKSPLASLLSNFHLFFLLILVSQCLIGPKNRALLAFFVFFFSPFSPTRVSFIMLSNFTLYSLLHHYHSPLSFTLYVQSLTLKPFCSSYSPFTSKCCPRCSSSSLFSPTTSL